MGAGRYDNHGLYDGQFWPKGGLVFSPAPSQSFRLTFNRALKSPAMLQTNFFFPDFPPFVGVFGNRDGYTIQDGAGAVVEHDAIEPETNNTWELGYKGVIANLFFWMSPATARTSTIS